MTLNSAIEAYLPFLRAEAEARMTDTCQITAPGTGKGPWNSSTGTYDAPPPVEVYRGKCELKAPAQVNPFTATAAGTNWQVEQSILKLPADSPSIEAGMTVNYLSAPNNPNLEGRVFGVIGPHHESMATAQRVIVKEAVGTGGTGT